MSVKKYVYGSLSALLFLAVAYALCHPLLKELYLSSRDDWDYFFFLHEVPSVSFFEFGEFPLWNPYCGGGMPLIGNPQAGYLSPIVIFTSMLGVVAGLKISVWLHTFLGLWGMWLLSGHLGMRGAARLAPPLIFMLSSSWAIHMAAGQIVWLPAAFLPLLFLTFLKASRNRRWYVLSAVLESLMFYEGGTYVFAFSLLFLCVYAILRSIEVRKWQPALEFVLVGITAGALSAPKLLPVLELLATHPRPTSVGDGDAVPLGTYVSYIIDRFHTVASSSVDFGSYFGFGVVILYFLSFFLFKKHRALVLTSIFMFFISLGNFGRFSPWHIMHQLPLFSGFHEGPTRSFIVFGFSVALMVGLYLQEVESTPAKRDAFLTCLVVVYFVEFSPWQLSHGFTFFSKFQHPTFPLIIFTVSVALLIVLNSVREQSVSGTKLLVGVVVLYIGVDLFLVSSSIFLDALKPANMFPSVFSFPANNKNLSSHYIPQFYYISPVETSGLRHSVAFDQRTFYQVRIPGIERNFHGAWSDQYLTLLQNKGVVDAYETIPIERYARAVVDENYRGEYYFLGKGKASLLHWSPNRSEFRIDLQEKDRLVINQNYWPGWRSSRGAVARQDGLVAVDLPPGTYEVVVRYSPMSFVIGLCIFVVTSASIIFFNRLHLRPCTARPAPGTLRRSRCTPPPLS